MDDKTKRVWDDICKKIEGTSTDKWDDIVKRHDLKWHEDSLRKKVTGEFGAYEMVNLYKEDSVCGEEILKEIDKKKVELQKERMKLQTAKIEYNRNLRRESRFELMFENIKESVERLESPTLIPTSTSDRKDRAYIQTLTDIHFGANFTSINNFYNIEECERRFENLLTDTIEYVALNRVDEIVLLNLGDSVQNILRLSDLKLNEVPVVEAIVGVSKIISCYINELSKYCRVKYLHVGAANHTQIRYLGAKHSELTSEDLEKLIANYIATSLSDNKNVEVPLEHLGSDRILFRVLGYNMIALHGHQVRNVDKALNDLSILHKTFFDVVWLGHYHAGTTKQVGEGEVCAEIVVAPSFVGSDPYADSLMTGSKGMSQIHMFEKRKGRVQINNIILN